MLYWCFYYDDFCLCYKAFFLIMFKYSMLYDHYLVLFYSMEQKQKI